MEYLQRPEFSSNIIQDVKTTSEAKQIANDYFPFAQVGYEYAKHGHEHAQKYIDKFYSGYKIDKSLSTRNHQVIIGKNNSIVNFTGTESIQTALKTWDDAGSKTQSKFLTRPILTALGGVYAKVKEGISTSAGEYGPLVDKAIKSGEDKFMEGSLTLEQRYEDAREVLKQVEKKYPTNQKLITGHSLGGLIAKKMATETNNNSLVFNAAIGKDVVHQYNGKTILEFRIDKEFVTGFGAGENPEYKSFIFPGAKEEIPHTNLTDPEDVFFSKFYTQRLNPHFLENFAIDQQHYRKVLSGEIKLKERPVETTYKPIKTPTVQQMIEVKRRRVENKKFFFPTLDLYGDVQNFSKKRKIINFFQ